MIRLLMQRGAHPQTATHMLIGYFGRKPMQRRMISLDSEPEQQERPAGRFRSLSDRVAHLTKDLGNPKADVNKSVGVLTTKVDAGFSQVETGFADVNKSVGVLTTKVDAGFSQVETGFADVNKSVGVLTTKVDAGFSQVETGFPDVNKSVGVLTTKVDAGFSQVETGFADVNKSVGVLATKVDVGFSQVETGFAKVETRFAAVERKLVFLQWQLGLVLSAIFAFCGFAGYTMKRVADAYIPLVAAAASLEPAAGRKESGGGEVGNARND